MSRNAVATFNMGSSSLKLSLFALREDGQLGDCLLRGAVRDLHGARRVDLETGNGAQDLQAGIEPCEDTPSLLRAIAAWMDGQSGSRDIIGAGHRVVHGGQNHFGPAIADAGVLAVLEKLSPLAPAHQPHNLAGVRALAEAWPDTVQTVSFDTAFHRSMPRIASLYALPRSLSDDGLLRYGFHGLSYAHIAETSDAVFGTRPKRLAALHLGSGASACALLDGVSVATTMGLTALDGLPMATRCGDLDPGVVLHLIQELGLSPDEVSDLLYRHSGLLGVSGQSGDMSALLKSGAPEAEEAVSLYCYRIAREVGSLCTALGGLDAVVFSGGVGENAPEIRERVLAHLAWLDLEIDAVANPGNQQIISASGSGVLAAIIPADEERVIARECAGLVSLS